jgi:hypothetical protein
MDLASSAFMGTEQPGTTLESLGRIDHSMTFALYERDSVLTSLKPHRQDRDTLAGQIVAAESSLRQYPDYPVELILGKNNSLFMCIKH